MEITGDALMASIVKPSLEDDESDAGEAVSGHEAIKSTIRALDEHEKMIEERRQKELDRLSDPRIFESTGAKWTYVEVDASYARIIRCETDVARLRIPEQLDGLEVLEIGPSACSKLTAVEEIICPEKTLSIGANAFRACSHLGILKLPRDTSGFDATWIAQCPNLSELVLPGMLDRVDASVLSANSLEVLELGIATRHIEPGAFAKSKLNELRIPSKNPFLETDGQSVFDLQTKSLLAVAAQTNQITITIPHGCRSIAAKAFAACVALERVIMPSSVESIGAHAFARTPLRAFSAPAALESIGRRAFYRCRSLEHVELNEGLLTIEEEAFAQTSLRDVMLPSSLGTLSPTAFDQSDLSFAGPESSCRFSTGSSLYLDPSGVLYSRRGPYGGKELRCVMGKIPSRYHVEEGTLSIADGAFSHNRGLCEVILPQGLVAIGASSFKGCVDLTRAYLPESVCSIGEEAFFDTSLCEVNIPACLEELGNCAFVTANAHKGKAPSSLQHIEVSPDNKHFFYVDGMLCEHLGDGGVRVVVYDGSESIVRMPSETKIVDAFAFSWATAVRELYLSTHISQLGPKALDVNCAIGHLHIDFEEAIESHTSIDLEFPCTIRSITEIGRAFNSSSFIDVEKILAHYDVCIVNMHDYDALNAEPVDLYGQVTRIIKRLRDPLFLGTNPRNLYMQIIRENLCEMCMAIARHDDRESIDALVELGFLNESTIIEVVEEVGRLQDAAMTGYLLEISRMLTGDSRRDFEL